MAGPIGSKPGGNRRRVFVLVDGGIVRGLFNSWDEAEAYADEKRFSLDHLMEYETRKDFPDHLHLLSAQWDEDWIFQGQWSKHLPRWQNPPARIRLEHYHFKGNEFQIFRQKEFDFYDGLIERINPMAPDNALVPDLLPPKPAVSPQWQPKLAPLRPAEPKPGLQPEDESPIHEPEFEDYPLEASEALSSAESVEPLSASQETETPGDSSQTGSESAPPHPDHPADMPEEAEREPTPSAPEEAIPPPVAEEETPASPAGPVKPRLTERGGASEPPKPGTPEGPPSQAGTQKPQAPTYPEAGGDEFSDLKPQARITFQKKNNPLRLRTKGSPQPIPSFKPAVPQPVEPIGKHSSVELAYAQQEEAEKKRKEEEQRSGKVRRVWSLRLIFTVIVLVLCWAGGLFWVLRPEPTATSIVAQITSLANARVMVFEPDMVFFQLEVDPIHQERWVKSLGLKPIDRGSILPMITYHALDTWTRPEGFVRPPYSVTEVNEWLDLRIRRVEYGFFYRWDDGSILILDLQSDILLGWGYARRYPQLFN